MKMAELLPLKAFSELQIRGGNEDNPKKIFLICQ